MGDGKRTDELTVIPKTYDFILWSWNPTGRFPRNHRFAPGDVPGSADDGRRKQKESGHDDSGGL